jgi:hypothetical protein
MAKKSKKKKDEAPAEIKPYEIIGATLNEDKCNYSYEIKTGPLTGDKHSVKGTNSIHEDLVEAFRRLNRHLACIDGGFKYIEFSNVDDLENNEISGQYSVMGIKMSGTEDDQKVQLTGQKYSTEVQGWHDINTCKVLLESFSSYKWYNELKEAADAIRSEVEQYMQGKCAPREEVEVVDKKQTKMFAGDDGFDNELQNAQL